MKAETADCSWIRHDKSRVTDTGLTSDHMLFIILIVYADPALMLMIGTPPPVLV